MGFWETEAPSLTIYCHTSYCLFTPLSSSRTTFSWLHRMQPYSLVEPSTPVIFHIASLVLAAVVTGAPFKATDESTLAGPFRPWKDSRTDTPIHALPMPWQVAADSQTPLFPAPLETWTPTGVDLDNITDYVNVTYRSGSIFCDTTNGSPDLFVCPPLTLCHFLCCRQ